MKVATLIFNPIGENTYVLWDETLECVIIDGGASTPAEQATLDNFIALDPWDGAELTASERYSLYGDGCEHLSSR